MQELSRKLGGMEYDGLITGLTPPVQVGGATIPKSESTVNKRGTLFGKSEGGTFAVMAKGLTPYGILCDDLDAGTIEEGENFPVYTAGCFDTEKLTVSEGYTLTEADKDKLRSFGIVLKAASR